MSFTRRRFLTATASTLAMTGCVGPHVAPLGSGNSYASQVLKPENHNTVFRWVDTAMQQV